MMEKPKPIDQKELEKTYAEKSIFEYFGFSGFLKGKSKDGKKPKKRKRKSKKFGRRDDSSRPSTKLGTSIRPETKDLSGKPSFTTRCKAIFNITILAASMGFGIALIVIGGYYSDEDSCSFDCPAVLIVLGVFHLATHTLLVIGTCFKLQGRGGVNSCLQRCAMVFGMVIVCVVIWGSIIVFGTYTTYVI